MKLIFIGLSLAVIGITLFFLTMMSYLYLIPFAVGIILSIVGLILRQTTAKDLHLKIYLAIAITALLGPCFYHIYEVNIGSHGPDIRFVIPHGFAGEIKIIVDPKQGIEFTKIDGKKKIIIPENGILRVKENLFEKWHQESATYDTGEALPMGDNTTIQAGEIAFYSLGAMTKTDENGNQKTSYHFFVGKEEALQKVRGW